MQIVLWEPNEKQERLTREYWISEAWRQWEIASCEERNNGHLWVLECIVEEEGIPSLYCEYCPVSLDDIFILDAQDLMYGELGDIKIDGGIHNSKHDVIIPVNVKTNAEKIYSPNYIYPEWDLWVELTLRGKPQQIKE